MKFLEEENVAVVPGTVFGDIKEAMIRIERVVKHLK
jgi:aspartate/methionine/tyrosine aminotransferase